MHRVVFKWYFVRCTVRRSEARSWESVGRVASPTHAHSRESTPAPTRTRTVYVHGYFMRTDTGVRVAGNPRRRIALSIVYRFVFRDRSRLICFSICEKITSL